MSISTLRWPAGRPLRYCYLVLIISLSGHAAQAQALPPTTPADTTLHKYQTPPGAARGPWYRGKLVRASLVPALLIGYGISVYDDHGFYSSRQAQADLQRNFPNFRSHLDDYGQWAPYLELGAVLAFGVEGRNDRVNLALILVKSEALMLGAVEITKRATNHLRPDGSDYRSFPSGHTAQAFLAASIVHTELRDKSQWYGVGAYAVATTVGAFRMLNNKHWESDVFAGAGVGILSAHLAYLSHRHRWGRHPAGRPGVGLALPKPARAEWQVSPTLLPGGGVGLYVSWRAK